MDQTGGDNNIPYSPQAPVEPAVAPQPEVAVPEAPNSDSLIKWNASEFVDHQKSVGWFLPLLIGIFVASCLMYLITRSILSTIVILLGGSAFVVFARQKPRTLSYTLGGTSITVGQRTYSYDDFRTFSILQEGALYSIFLEPIKRFMPPLSIYFAPEDGEKIFDVLAAHIPHQERQPDPVERLMRRIRF